MKHDSRARPPGVAVEAPRGAQEANEVLWRGEEQFHCITGQRERERDGGREGGMRGVKDE